VAFGVREVADHEIRSRFFLRAYSTRPAEALGLLERSFDVRNADVEDHVALVAHPSADAAGDPGPVAGRVAVHEPVVSRLGDRLRARLLVLTRRQISGAEAPAACNPVSLQPLLHARLNNRSIRQQNDKEHLPQRPFDRVRKADQPEWDRTCPKFLSLRCADLYVVKCRHKVGGDLCHFLFGYALWDILLIAFENVFQRAAVLGRASVSEQLNGERWGCQHDGGYED
jgi:hypothetical protein